MPRLHALTGLRFIAAAMIVAHHIQGVVWLPVGAFGSATLGAGVSFFFCLSGFVLHYGYRDKINEIGALSFVFLRFARLWPAHVVMLTVCLILFWSILPKWLIDHNTPRELLAIVFLLQSWVPDQTVFFAWNSPAWSISTELAFYFAFPLICRGLATRPAATTICVFAIVAGYLCVASAWFYNPLIPGNAFGLAGTNPIARVGEFTLGALTWEIMLRRKLYSTKQFADSAEILVLAVAAAGVIWGPQYLAILQQHTNGVISVWLDVCFLAPVCCIMIAVFSRHAGVVSRALSAPVMVWLGNVSFAVYLTHQPIINAFEKYGSGNAAIEFPAFLALTLGLSTLIYHYVELPSIRVSRRLVKRATRPAMSATASCRQASTAMTPHSNDGSALTPDKFRN